MTLKGWCNQNAEQANAARDTFRVLNFQVVPDTAGGNANLAGGKIVGNVQLQNLTPELAAAFAGSPEVDIVITVREPA